MYETQEKRQAYLPMIGVIVTMLLLAYCREMLLSGKAAATDSYIMLLAIVMVFVVAIYTVYVAIKYIIIISKKENVPRWKKLLWIIVLIRYTVWVFPLFWHFHLKIKHNGEIDRG